MQIRDPFDPKRRISVTAPTPGEVISRAETIRTARRDLRNGADGTDALRRLTAARCDVLTVREAWDSYLETLAENWQPTAKAYWRLHFAPRLGRLAAVELTELAMRDWEADRLKSGASPRYVWNLYASLAAAMARAVKAFRLARIPWGDWRPKDRPQKGARLDRREAMRSAEEFAALVVAALRRDKTTRAAQGYADLTHRCIILCTLGLRQGEGGGLGWDHVDFGSAAARIEWQVRDAWQRRHPDWPRPMDPVKGRKVESVGIAPAALHVLGDQRRQLSDLGWYRDDGPVFPRRGGGWRTHAETIGPEQFHALAKDAGFPHPEKWVPHSLRHSAGTLNLLATGDLVGTSKLLRHADLQVTQSYLRELGRGLPTAQFSLPGASVQVPALVEHTPRLALPPLDTIDPVQASAEDRAAHQNRPRPRSGVGPVQRVLAAARGDDPTATPSIRRERQNRDEDDPEAAVERWVAAGCPGKRPVELTRAMRVCYQSSYNAVLRAGEPSLEAAGEKARKAGENEREARALAAEALKAEARRAGRASYSASRAAWAKRLRVLVAAHKARKAGADEAAP